MRKIRKVRFLACVMCAALVLGSLTGCGGVSDDTAQKDGQKNTALVNALRKSKEANSVNMDTHLKLFLKMQFGVIDKEEALSADCNAKISRFRTPFHMKSNAKIVTDTMTEGPKIHTSQTLEAYASKENDKYVVYDRLVEDEDKSAVAAWEKSEGADQDAINNSMSYLNISADDLDDDASRYTRLDDVKDHGITYQAYKYIMTPEEALKWIRRLCPMEPDSATRKVDQQLADAAEKLEDTEMTFLVDPEKEEIHQWSWNNGKVLEAYMNVVMNILNDDWWLDDDTCGDEDDDEYEDLDEASDDEEKDEDGDAEDEENDRDAQEEASTDADDMNFALRISDCSMDYTVTFSNWNAAFEFEIPEEVIKAAESKESKQQQESEDE